MKRAHVYQGGERIGEIRVYQDQLEHVGVRAGELTGAAVGGLVNALYTIAEDRRRRRRNEAIVCALTKVTEMPAVVEQATALGVPEDARIFESPLYGYSISVPSSWRVYSGRGIFFTHEDRFIASRHIANYNPTIVEIGPSKLKVEYLHEDPGSITSYWMKRLNTRRVAGVMGPALLGSHRFTLFVGSGVSSKRNRGYLWEAAFVEVGRRLLQATLTTMAEDDAAEQLDSHLLTFHRMLTSLRAQ